MKNREIQDIERVERYQHSDRMDRYHERQTQRFYRKTNNVCLDCKKTSKLSSNIRHKICPHCGSSNFYEIGSLTRAPRMRASKRKWLAFAKRFCKYKNSCLC